MNQSSFIEELKKIGIILDENKLEKLNKYYELLIEYNKVMNLTGITEKESVYLKHFYDSLTISKIIDLNEFESLCDMGTGAGFPGLVLKIVYPHLHIVLVDSLNKRLNFLNEVINELKLNNIETVHARMEDYGLEHRNKFDVVTARAVAQTNVLLEYAIPITKVNGYFIPLKGNLSNENDYERACKVLKTALIDKIEFKLPIENSDRTILKFKKIGETDKKYPRKNIEIKKNPL